jgi:hypothetical protein
MIGTRRFGQAVSTPHRATTASLAATTTAARGAPRVDSRIIRTLFRSATPLRFRSHFAALGDVTRVATTHRATARATTSTRDTARSTIGSKRRITVANHLLLYVDFTSP